LPYRRNDHAEEAPKLIGLVNHIYEPAELIPAAERWQEDYRQRATRREIPMEAIGAAWKSPRRGVVPGGGRFFESLARQKNARSTRHFWKRGRRSSREVG